MSKSIPLDKKVRQRLAYVFLLPEVGQPIKQRAKLLLERARAAQAQLDRLAELLDGFEKDDIDEWWSDPEIAKAKRDAKKPVNAALVKWD